MPKSRLKSQKLSEILRNENFEITRFFLLLTHKKISLTRSIFEIKSSSLGFYVIQKSCFASFALQPIFKNIIFLLPPSEVGWGKNSNSNFAKNLIFDIYEKSRSFKSVWEQSLFPQDRVKLGLT